MATKIIKHVIDGAEIMDAMTIEVTVTPPLGWCSWRLWIARPLLNLACWLLRCNLSIKGEFVEDGSMEAS